MISKELIQQLREMAMIDKGGWCSMAAVEFTQKHMKALLDEIDRLTHLHDLDHSLVDQKQAEIERLREEVEVTYQCKDEAYCDWYICKACGCSMITEKSKYCPDCGRKIKRL